MKAMMLALWMSAAFFNNNTAAEGSLDTATYQMQKSILTGNWESVGVKPHEGNRTLTIQSDGTFEYQWLTGESTTSYTGAWQISADGETLSLFILMPGGIHVKKAEIAYLEGDEMVLNQSFDEQAAAFFYTKVR